MMEQEPTNNEMQLIMERIKTKNVSGKRTYKWSFILCLFFTVMLALLVLLKRGLPNSEVNALYAAAFPMWTILCFERWKNAEKVEGITDSRELLRHFDRLRRIEWVLFAVFFVILEGVIYYCLGLTPVAITGAVVLLIIVILRLCGLDGGRDIERLRKLVKQENEKSDARLQHLGDGMRL